MILFFALHPDLMSGHCTKISSQTKYFISSICWEQFHVEHAVLNAFADTMSFSEQEKMAWCRDNVDDFHSEMKMTTLMKALN